MLPVESIGSALLNQTSEPKPLNTSFIASLPQSLGPLVTRNNTPESTGKGAKIFRVFGGHARPLGTGP